MKKRKLIYLVGTAVLFSNIAMASDSVSAAMSEDLDAFAALANKRITAPNAPKKPKPANFGAVVSAKAHEVQGAAPDDEKNFGQWVSKQRRNNDSHDHAAGGSQGAGSGSQGGGATGSGSGGAGNGGSPSNAGGNGNGGGNGNAGGNGNGHGHGH